MSSSSSGRCPAAGRVAALSLDAKLAAVIGRSLATSPSTRTWRCRRSGDRGRFRPSRRFVSPDSAGRRSQASEAEWPPNREIVAPDRLKKALKAKHGLEPWNLALEASPSRRRSRRGRVSRLTRSHEQVACAQAMAHRHRNGVRGSGSAARVAPSAAQLPAGSSRHVTATLHP